MKSSLFFPNPLLPFLQTLKASEMGKAGGLTTADLGNCKLEGATRADSLTQIKQSLRWFPNEATLCEFSPATCVQWKQKFLRSFDSWFGSTQTENLTSLLSVPASSYFSSLLKMHA